jgi:hypothetical protein
MKGLFAYDGPIGRLLLSIFQFFIVSVQFVATAMLAVLYDRIVGWQTTHVAIWLGALALTPIGPGVYAVLASMRDFLAEGGYPGAPIRRFWRAYREGAARLWWWWLGVTAFVVLLGYNAALYGASGVVFAGIVIAAALVAVASVAVCCAVLLAARGRRLQLLAAAFAAGAARPLVVLAWLLLVVVASAAAAIPVVGTSLMLFLPALAGWAILIVNATTGFDAKLRAATRAGV